VTAPLLEARTDHISLLIVYVDIFIIVDIFAPPLA